MAKLLAGLRNLPEIGYAGDENFSICSIYSITRLPIYQFSSLLK